MKVAIVHYWLVNMRGGEKVVEALLDLFPDADIFSHVVDETRISQRIRDRIKGTTFVNSLPASKRFYQSYLPLMPLALEQLDLRDYDLIISSESGPAKGIIPSPEAVHICYCHSPMRYIWDMFHEYRERAGFVKRTLMPILAHRLRMWDFVSAQRVDQFIANSHFVSKRIQKYYRRDSEVIFPPVEITDFEVGESSGDFYLLLGQLVRYKRPRMVVEAFNRTGRNLVVIGDGEELDSLESIAKSNVQILGYQPFNKIRDYYSKCRALIFPGIEDFGMVPVEAMASGKPVIALGRGGALDTVIPGETGVLFEDSSIDSLNQAIDSFEANASLYAPAKIRAHSENFSREAFLRRFSAIVDQSFSDKRL